MNLIAILNGWTGFDLVPWQWIILCLNATVLGISKTGINGVITVTIPLMALIFGARESTGIMLPMLCFADILAVVYYRRSAGWKYIFKLLPWALAGFAVALFVDHLVPVRAFKILIGICILIGIVIMLWNEFMQRKTARETAQKDTGHSEPKKVNPVLHILKQAVFGITGGFSTMIGNAAGPVMSIYLLSMRLPKLMFVGTAAWFFMIVNYLKIPVQVIAWNNITLNGLKLGLLMVPFIITGALLGIILVKKASEIFYRRLVIGMTLLTTVLLFL